MKTTKRDGVPEVPSIFPSSATKRGGGPSTNDANSLRAPAPRTAHRGKSGVPEPPKPITGTK